MKIPISSFLVVLISSCAVPYQTDGQESMFRPNGGYSEEWKDKNRVVVRFQGNRFNSMEEINRFLLLRCAEIARESECGYFKIVSKTSNSLDQFARVEIELLADKGSGEPGDVYHVDSILNRRAEWIE